MQITYPVLGRALGGLTDPEQPRWGFRHKIGEPSAYDWLIEGKGKNIFYTPSANRDLDVVEEMLRRRATLVGLGNGGAHYGHLYDAARDHTRNYTSLTDVTVGLADRGLVAEGPKADLNIIDYAALQLAQPEVKCTPPVGLSITHKSSQA